MININNIPVRNEEYTKEKLPYRFTAEEKERSENGEQITIKGKKYFLELPFFEDETDSYFEELVQKHVDYDFNPKRGIEITRMIYGVMGLDWYFQGNKPEVSDDGSLSFTLKFSDDCSSDLLIVKTDIIEYGFAAAMEFIEQLNKEKELC